MAITLSQLLTNVRSLIDESAATFFSDSQLTQWLNDGMNDMARTTECLNETINSSTMAFVSQYNLPTNILRLNGVTYIVNNESYPLTPTTRDNVNRIFGGGQSPTGIPLYYQTFGIAGNAANPAYIILYPTPSQAATLQFYYYRPPYPVINPTDVAEIPLGWEDVPVIFAQYKAMQRDNDPNWTNVQQLYDQKLQQLARVNRTGTDRQLEPVSPTNPRVIDVGRELSTQTIQGPYF